MGGAKLTGPARGARVARSVVGLLTKRNAHWWWSVLSVSFLAGVYVAASTQGYTLRWNAPRTRSPAPSEQAVTWVPAAHRHGNLIYVTRGHGQVAAFRVYPLTPGGTPPAKNAVPGGAVYGFTRHPHLRLVTCEGTFDRRARHCLGHVVVAARLANVRR